MFWRGGPTPTADGNVSLVAGHHARRRHHDQLDQLPAHAALGARAVGREHGLEGRRRARLRPPPRRGAGADRRERRLQRPERRPAAPAGGRRGARLELRDDHPQHRPDELLAGDRRLPRLRRPVGQQAERRPHLARRRPGARRALPDLHPRHAGPGRGRPRRRRGGGLADAGRPRRAGDRAGAARGRRLRLARVPGAAAALRDRRPGGRREPAAASLRRVVGGAYGEDQQAWWGAAAGRALRRVRRHRRRLRLPDRDRAVRAGPDRLGDALDLGRRPQAADGASSASAAPSSASPATAAHGQVGVDAERRGGADLLRHRRARPREPARGHRGPDPAARGGGRPPDRPARRRARRPGAAATTSRRSSPARKRIPFRAGGYKLFSAHQMGTCRMGQDPQTSVADPCGELHDTKGVWIGDGSAFPTSSGTNPMVSIMALAHRTAEAIADDAGAAGETKQAEAAADRPNRDASSKGGAPWQPRTSGTRTGRSPDRADRPRHALHRRRVGRARRAAARSR